MKSSRLIPVPGKETFENSRIIPPLAGGDVTE